MNKEKKQIIIDPELFQDDTFLRIGDLHLSSKSKDISELIAWAKIIIKDKDCREALGLRNGKKTVKQNSLY